jgi:hypothetical protein
MHIDRRTFLRITACAAGGAVLSACKSVSSTAELSTHPQPCPAAAWQKHGIVLEASEAWEDNDIQNFTCPAEPLKGDAWRLWYSVSSRRDRFNIAFAEGIPGGPMKKFAAQLSPGDPPDAPFAVGHLPEKWRPVQVIHLRLRNGKHRIYFWAHGPGILRYLAAESDDGRRYRVINPLRAVLYHPGDRAAHGVATPDGLLIHKQLSRERPADEPLALSRLVSNDATNIYQLPDGTFELYSVGLIQIPKTDPAYMPHDNAPGLLRVMDRYTSADGLHFETRQRIIQRDAEDPVDQQFYYLSVTHTAKGRVGMLGHYRCDAQTMDLEWCFSRDGAQWERPLRRAWLPRGEPPAPDCYGIYSANQLVRHDGRWHLFHTGVNSSHNGRQSHGKPRQVVMLATTDSIWA